MDLLRRRGRVGVWARRKSFDGMLGRLVGREAVLVVVD